MFYHPILSSDEWRRTLTDPVEAALEHIALELRADHWGGGEVLADYGQQSQYDIFRASQDRGKDLAGKLLKIHLDKGE